VGAAAPTDDPDRVLVALADRLAVVSLDDGSLETLAVVPHGPDMRLNDGAVDPAGRFWVGSMALDERPGVASLYRFAGGELERALDGVTLSNGLGWSPDGRRMYYVDSPTRRVDLLDFDVETGSISGRRPFAEIEPEAGIPDGLAVDDEEGVWVALFAGRAVRRYTWDGSLDRVVDLPVAKVTACAFGGDDGRDLYVTTASLDDDDPLAGAVFVTRVDVPGPPAVPFPS